jgi:hypothetical protein
MATGRAAFIASLGGSITPGIPDFPKLPECLKKRLSEAEKKEVEQYEADVQEFFKKQAIRGM